MPKFYVTFGQQSPARNGVVEVEAPGEIDVRLYANHDPSGKQTFANWCSVHSQHEWEDGDYALKREFYPYGVLKSITIGPQREPLPLVVEEIEEDDEA